MAFDVLSLKRNAMWENGSHAMNSSSPTMLPRMLTVRVVPTPRGSGLVHATLVITVAQCGHDSASAKHLEQLLGGDREVDGADEPERCAVDEVEVDAFARVGLGHE